MADHWARGRLARVGDYIVKEVEICGASILVTRLGNGDMRACHNVGSHRSSQVVWQRNSSRTTMFLCAYHRWTYGNDGRLSVRCDV